jgi:outer membrane lipoprotein-sorting protein
MSTHWSAMGLALLFAAANGSAHAQDTKNPAPRSAAVATPSDQRAGVLGDRLTKQQRDTVQKVNQYLNQLTTLKGTFVQTAADNKRLRGRFHIKRPGQFRFDYAPPSRLVIVSDGKYVAIQDHDLGTDDRWDLEYTPFRMLLRKDVDLLRDGRFFDVQEREDAITISVVEKDATEASSIRLTLTKKPALQVKEWTAKDAQGFDTRIALDNATKADDLDPNLFNPALTKQGR